MPGILSKIAGAALLLGLTLSSASAADRFVFRGPMNQELPIQSDGSSPTVPTAPGGPTTPTTPTTPTVPVSDDPKAVATDFDFRRGVYYAFRANSNLVEKGVTKDKWTYTGIPLSEWFVNGYGLVTGFPRTRGTFTVTATHSGMIDGKFVSVSTTFKVKVADTVSQLTLRQGPVSFGQNTQWKGKLEPEMSGKWEKGAQADSLQTYAEYGISITGTPGTVKPTYDSVKKTWSLAGYTGNTLGAFPARITVTEKVYYRYPNIQSSGYGANIQYFLNGQTGPFLLAENTASQDFVITVDPKPQTEGRFFRFTIDNYEEVVGAHGTEIEFFDEAGNKLTASHVTSNRFVKPGSAPFDALVNGVRSIDKEVEFCPTAACDTGDKRARYLVPPSQFVVEFDQPVSPVQVYLYSKGPTNGYWVNYQHHFYKAAEKATPLMERSMDGVNWGEIYTRFSRGFTGTELYTTISRQL